MSRTIDTGSDHLHAEVDNGVAVITMDRPEPATSWDEGVHGQRLSHRDTSGALFEMPKPTVAVLPGPAAGAGLSLALACDLRIAADTAIMTTAFARVGLAGDYGGTWFLTQLVGPSKAKELYFLSSRIDMATAKELGIVNMVVSADELEGAARTKDHLEASKAFVDKRQPQFEGR
jgi:2-(1,2-epoxy-1,2-dihydrophenyl)acetyl-CoA isomerase